MIDLRLTEFSVSRAFIAPWGGEKVDAVTNEAKVELNAVEA